MYEVRIAVTGAQGTGKSTLARALAGALREQFPGKPISLLEGIGSDVAHLGLPLGTSADVDTLHAFITAHFRRERLAGPGIVIQDRCLIDLLAYARLVRSADQHLLDMIAELARCAMSRVALVFYTPITQATRECRSANETAGFREAIEREIVTASAAVDVNLIIISGDSTARLAAALEHVRTRIR